MRKNLSFKHIGIAGLVVVNLLLFTGTGWALTWTYSYDPYNDATGGNIWEAYRMGYASDDQYLYFNMWVGLPISGASAEVTYGTTWLEPGDLYINVGGEHNAGTGDVYGLALTTHSGDMNNDPNDNSYPWSPVTQGHLYSDALFATGTYEGYPNAGPTGTPYDGGLDPFGHRNNYPTHIAGYGTDLGYQGPVTWTYLGYTDVDPSANTKNRPVYEVNARISLVDLGLQGGGTFELWWAAECGNDGAMIAGSVPTPEPGTLGLLSMGFLSLGGYVIRRKRS